MRFDMKGALFEENKPGLLTSTTYIRRLSNIVGQARGQAIRLEFG